MRRWTAGWATDVRQGLRGLKRSPGFTGVALLTLALGMGASAAVYTLLDGIVLDPLSYPRSERLVELTNQVPGVGPDEVWAMSTAQYVHLVDHARSLEAVGLYRGLGANIHTTEGPERVFGWRVTASVLPLLGAKAHLGQLIGPSHDRPDASPVVVLSQGLWQRAFGEDRTVIGRTIRIDDQPFEVIGVVEAGVRLPDAPPGLSGDFFFPMGIDPAGFFGNNHVFPMIARLAEGTDPATAEAEIERLKAGLPQRFPQAYSQAFFDRYGFRTRVTPLKEAVVGETSRNLWILFGAVGLLLVLACANVANLFVVRTDAQRRELAIRRALGAGRAAIARHLLAEGLALSLSGGILALVLGYWGVPAALALAPDSLPRSSEVGLGGGTVIFTILVSIGVGLGLAAYPLVRHSGDVDPDALAGGHGSVGPGQARQRVRSALVVAQVALALTLVVGAGLLVATLRELRALDPGVQAEGVLTAGLYLTPSRYRSDREIWRAYAEILERVRAIPGVTEAGMSAELPIEGGFGCTVQGFEDVTVYDRVREAGLTTCAGEEPTTPGYFESLGIPVLQGRSFTDADNDDPSSGAVVVSRAFAERFWPGEDPIGKGVAPHGRTEPPFHHVVGVVGDVPAGSLHGRPAMAIYYPVVAHPETPDRWGGWSPTTMKLVARTGLTDPLRIVPELSRAVTAVDPTAPLTDARSFERILAESTARFSFTSALLNLAAFVALLLAAVGLYGVVAYVVGGRTREIGMRIAMGARPSEVQRLFVVRSLVLVGMGLAVGVGVALATTRVLEGLLFGVTPTDPVAFAGAATLLGAVALLASWIPARRAANVDPVEALRAD